MKTNIQLSVRLIGFVLIFLLLALFIRNVTQAQPTETKIVYIVRDENGTENLWLADINDPLHPEQLTHFDQPDTFIFYQVAHDGHTLVYQPSLFDNSSIDGEIMLLDLRTRQTQQLTVCHETDAWCDQFSIRPDTHYVAYYEHGESVHVIDLTASPTTDQTVYDFGNMNMLPHALPNWVDDTGLLAFNLPGDPFEFQVFDVERNVLISILPLGLTITSATLFSRWITLCLPFDRCG